MNERCTIAVRTDGRRIELTWLDPAAVTAVCAAVVECVAIVASDDLNIAEVDGEVSSKSEAIALLGRRFFQRLAFATEIRAVSGFAFGIDATLCGSATVRCDERLQDRVPLVDATALQACIPTASFVPELPTAAEMIAAAEELTPANVELSDDETIAFFWWSAATQRLIPNAVAVASLSVARAARTPLQATELAAAGDEVAAWTSKSISQRWPIRDTVTIGDVDIELRSEYTSHGGYVAVSAPGVSWSNWLDEFGDALQLRAPAAIDEED